MNGHEKLVKHVNRKSWWHVPPLDPTAYDKRGKFLASSFAEAEFYGRPLDEAQRVKICNPIVGDEATIELELLGKLVAHDEMGIEARLKHDARLKQKAVKRGYDSIALMSPKCFGEYKRSGKIPRSIELNVFANGNQRISGN